MIACIWEDSPSYAQLLRSFLRLTSDFISGTYKDQPWTNFLTNFTQLDFLVIFSLLPVWYQFRFRWTNGLAKVVLGKRAFFNESSFCTFFVIFQWLVTSLKTDLDSLPRISEGLFHAINHTLVWLLTFYVVILDIDCSVFFHPSDVWQSESMTLFTSVNPMISF